MTRGFTYRKGDIEFTIPTTSELYMAYLYALYITNARDCIILYCWYDEDTGRTSVCRIIIILCCIMPRWKCKQRCLQVKLEIYTSIYAYTTYNVYTIYIYI